MLFISCDQKLSLAFGQPFRIAYTVGICVLNLPWGILYVRAGGRLGLWLMASYLRRNKVTD